MTGLSLAENHKFYGDMYILSLFVNLEANSFRLADDILMTSLYSLPQLVGVGVKDLVSTAAAFFYEGRERYSKCGG